MKSFLFILSFIVVNHWAFCQYQFKDEIRISATPVKNQMKTGTCWSFSTTSFLESELLRMGKGSYDLSEMYNVRKVYEEKAYNYIMRQGAARFSQGGLAHNVLSVIKEYGIIPGSVYSGLVKDDTVYNHGELTAVLKGMLDGVLESGKPGPHWKDAFSSVLDQYLGPPPESFVVDGKTYNPIMYKSDLGIDPDNYISITSFNHHPFNQAFILEIPDNFSNGTYINVKLDQLMSIVDEALEKGYSLVWDGDSGEEGFVRNGGIAVLPSDPESKYMESPCDEMEVTQENRQRTFESFSTTDDHLMHVIGTAIDQHGGRYYIIKNSWGTYGPYRGLLYMSEAYFRMKTISVTVHRDAIPEKFSSIISIK